MRVFNFLMMKIDVCIISGNFIENPKLVFNLNFHVIFSCQVIESIFTFPFLTVRFLLFQNSSDPDVHSLDPHPPPSLFFKGRGEGGSKFYYLHQRGEGQKNKKKGVEVWCRGRSSQKGGTFSI